MSSHPNLKLPTHHSRDSPPKTPLPKTPRILPAHLKYAREMKRGFGKELRVYFTSSFQTVLNVNDIWRNIVSCNDPTQSFIEVERERAEIVVDFEKDGLVSFFTNNPYAAKYGVDRMRHTVPPRLEPVAHVLRGIARWNYFFRRRNNTTTFLQSINIEFYRIEEDKRTGKTNFVGRNLNRSGRIDLPADPKESYSMHIFNDSDLDLYPYLLYFDVREQSIEPYFFPPMNEETNVEVPLPAHASCTIGCTADGLSPFVFALGEGEHADIGFFKLYLTKSPIDIFQIVQESPFQFLKTAAIASRTALNNPRPKLFLDYIESNNEEWGTISVAVVQRVNVNVKDNVDSHKSTNNTLRPSWQINLPAQLQSQGLGQPYQTNTPFHSRSLPLPKADTLPMIFSSSEDLAFRQSKPVISNASRESSREKESRRTATANQKQQSQSQPRQRKESDNVAQSARYRKESIHRSPLKNSVTGQEMLGSLGSEDDPSSATYHRLARSHSVDEYVRSPQLGENMYANLDSISITNPEPRPYPYPYPSNNLQANNHSESVQSLNGPQGSVNSNSNPNANVNVNVNTKHGKNPATKILNAFKLFKKK